MSDKLEITEVDRTTGEVKQFTGREAHIYLFIGFMIPVMIGFLAGFAFGYFVWH